MSTDGTDLMHGRFEAHARACVHPASRTDASVAHAHPAVLCARHIASAALLARGLTACQHLAYMSTRVIAHSRHALPSAESPTRM